MRKTILDAVSGIKSRILIALLFVFSVVLLYFDRTMGIIGFGVIVVIIISNHIILRNNRKLVREAFQQYTETVAAAVDQALANHPVPVVVIDGEGHITWYSRNFLKLMPTEEIVNEKIENFIPKIKGRTSQKPEDLDKEIIVNIREKLYKVVRNEIEGEANMSIMYFIDTTHYENLKTMYREEKVCFAYLNVDNYEELLDREKEEKKSLLASQIDVLIRQWIQKISANVVQYGRDKYYIIFERKYLERLEANKFSIIDEIREIENEADFPVSISMGVGVGGKNLLQLEEYAKTAIDLALGRGGDQVVVKKVNKIEYYGGRLQTVEKRNKGKSRIMAHAIRQLIDQSSNVVIVGHKNPDMDAFGAAVGVAYLAKLRNKESAIIINNVDEAIDSLYQSIKETKEYELVSSEAVREIIDKDTLLVVVDTHRPIYTDDPELLKEVEKIIVIDHHRKMEENIENAILTYMEPYASSTSELITEIIECLIDSKAADKIVAEALLAGMTVDTKHFTMRTGVRTLEAATWLRRAGADTGNIRRFFKTNVDLFKVKAKIILEARIIKDNIAFSVHGEAVKDAGLIAAQVADEFLEMKGIDAAFVVVKNETGYIMVSARSLGEMNVQRIMEKLGGGGHLNMAGAQLDCPIEEAEGMLIGAIEEAFAN